MSVVNSIVSICSILFVIGSAKARPDFTGLPLEPYCKEKGCCDGRIDQCSAPIYGTLCYCDAFCDRERSEDCCPDYWSHCKGEQPDPEPILRGCRFNGKDYYYKEVAKINCNECKCEKVGNQTEMLCEGHTCLIEPDITNTVNQYSDRYGWTATNYSRFWGRKLEEGIKLRLGTLKPDRFVLKMSPLKRIYDPNSLPKQFDAEKKWPGLINNIQDQGWCGSSWALSTAAVASDRFAIISKGLEHVMLSAQNLLSCDNRGQQSCDGGYLDRAWMYMRKFGVVDERCLPYTGKNEKCHIPRKGNLKTARCLPASNPDRTEKYRVAPAYRLGNETDIMYDIVHSGPVQVTIKVYHDFFTYQRGIYKHTEHSSMHRTGYHSVRIVGWGEEYTHSGVQKFWKVANSWGPEWGEGGYFRIVRGTNECEIESFVLGTWPEIQSKRSFARRSVGRI